MACVSPFRVIAGILLMVAACTAPAEDLAVVYRLALENNPEFLAAQATRKASLQKYPQARAALLPTIGASASTSREDIEIITDAGIVSRPAGRATTDRGEYSVSLTQPVYNQALFSALTQARAEVRRAEIEYAAAREDLIVRVAEAYFGVLAAEDDFELARAEKTAIARQHELANARLEVGLVAITDVHDAKARFALADAREIEAANNLADRREVLYEVTGRSFGQLSRIGKEMPLVPPEPTDSQQWTDKALEQNLALMARKETVKIARQEIKRNRAAHLPTLDLVGSYRRTDADSSITGPGVRADNSAIGLELTVPIFQGGLTQSLIKEAAHRYDAALRGYESEKRATERTTRSAYLNVSSAARRVSALDQAVIASQSALDAKTEGFEAGINTNLDVLDAQRDLFRAKRDYLQARYGYIFNLLRLKKAAGILSEKDITQVNRWLQSPSNDEDNKPAGENATENKRS